jgi:hypothetical protein
MERIFIRVSGIFSKELIPRFKGILDYSDITINETILFCDYSDFDVPLEHVFNSIEYDNGEKLIDGPIVLKKLLSNGQCHMIRYHVAIRRFVSLNSKMVYRK